LEISLCVLQETSQYEGDKNMTVTNAFTIKPQELSSSNWGSLLELVEKPLDWWFDEEIAWKLELDEGRP